MNRSDYDTDLRNTCVVIVTYGDRIHLLEPVVEKVMTMGVGCVVVVDNGSAPQSRTGMQQLLDHYKDRLQMVELKENRGSAGGFKAGLRRAEETGLQYIWILDDDNKPRSDALKRLFDAYRLMGSVPKYAFCSSRVIYNEPNEKAGPLRPITPLVPNSFLGFHLKSLPKKVLSRFNGPAEVHESSVPLKQRQCAMYGGFFFHCEWLGKIGYPNEEFFVDMDDIEYSSRLIQQGGSIYQCCKSIIFDTDSSWPSGNMFVRPEASEARVYYSVRNRLFLGKRGIKNSILYYTNAVSYLFYLCLTGMLAHRNLRSFLNRTNLIFRAIQDGRKNRLGSRTELMPIREQDTF